MSEACKSDDIYIYVCVFVENVYMHDVFLREFLKNFFSHYIHMTSLV